MDDRSLIDLLEELAEKLGVKIRYEAIRQDEDAVHVAGGLCLLRGEYVLIVNSRDTAKERIHTLAKALKHFDLDQVYLRPALRELLDKIP
jgi:Zn-dependent peptidase ImmA (M78 family)